MSNTDDATRVVPSFDHGFDSSVTRDPGPVFVDAWAVGMRRKGKLEDGTRLYHTKEAALTAQWTMRNGLNTEQKRHVELIKVSVSGLS